MRVRALEYAEQVLRNEAQFLDTLGIKAFSDGHNRAHRFFIDISDELSVQADCVRAFRETMIFLQRDRKSIQDVLKEIGPTEI